LPVDAKVFVVVAGGGGGGGSAFNSIAIFFAVTVTALNTVVVARPVEGFVVTAS